MELTAYCMDWHITQSGAFKKLLVEPLSSRAEIRLTPWDGYRVPKPPSPKRTLVFCMLPPDQTLLSRSDINLVWIPMWDQAQGYDDSWWKNLPKSLRVIAFSERVYEKAIFAGLQVLRLQYFLDPMLQSSAKWHDGHTLFYWNRVGLVGPNFLRKLCESLEIRKFLFKPVLDPRISSDKYYTLPRKLGSTEVVTIGSTKTHQEFLRLIEPANIVLAPRLTEGVGMVFLESMSRGCAVIANDGSTMNEYISSGRNGLLLRGGEFSLLRRIAKRFIPKASPFLLSDSQPWRKMAEIDFQILGNKAREDHRTGYNKWQKSLEEYADFVLNWG
ncbi:glycosyltransferase [Candidatus Saccharibacteria bacterium]|nr:glycosyltransferase [Candidatus Saccharibacteria bacterium]